MSTATATTAGSKDKAGSDAEQKVPSSHLHDWPNDAGFQTLAEQREPTALKVVGAFPAAVAGTLLRTGPAQREVEGFKLSHWFDGFSKIYRFQLIAQSDGSCKVLYNSRSQVDAQLERARRTGRLDGITFAQKRDPCVSFFGKLKAVFEPSRSGDPADMNIGVTIHSPVKTSTEINDGKPYWENRTDSAQLKYVDAETLEPIGVSDQSKLHPELTGPLSSAHAQFDPVTGECYNYNLAFGRSSTYKVFCTDPKTGATKVLATITGGDVAPSYVHSFFLTENYVVLCIWTAHFARAGLATLWERNLLDAISPFDQNAATQWFVVDRRHGKGVVKQFTSKAMFCFHTINAFEGQAADGSVNIIADLIEYPNLDILHRLYYDNLLSNAEGARKYQSTAEDRTGTTRPGMARYKLSDIQRPAAAKEPAEAQRIMFLPGPNAGELPTTNPNHQTKPYRYYYGLCDRGLSSFVDGITKTDLKTGETSYWSKAKHTPGEAIFVVDPERSGKEDGGWLLSCILNGETGTSYLLCLDAETLREVGRAEGEVAWGLGFHGMYAKI